MSALFTKTREEIMNGTNAATISALTERAMQEATEVEGEYGAHVTRLEVSKMADGSERWAAILTMEDGIGHEMQLRVAAPAPEENAPGWARVHNGYEVEHLDLV